ncbi:MAG: hypothetical protein M1819_006026 [Sarea resinae]|nr:MAG: hypothetical protein M1819_006026 [Sarea resinae]
MAPPLSKKRKVEDGMRGKIHRSSKKSRKQRYYESSSSEDEAAPDARNADQEDFAAVDLQDSEVDNEDGDTVAAATAAAGDAEVESSQGEGAEDEMLGSDSESEGASSASDSGDSQQRTRKRKRNDPDAFATSMSKILGSKLSTSKRVDPVLARSKSAAVASQELQDSRLEAKARHKLREEKRAEMDKGRVRDVLGLEDAIVGSDGQAVSVGQTLELEKRLKKTAQRGVIKLFNAVRAAQVKAEEAAREARKSGTVGMGRKEERVNEMSKKGFLDLIAGGGAKRTATPLEEA